MADNKDDLLKKLGFTVADLDSDDFDLKATVDNHEATQKKKYEKLFKNDTDYKDEIERATTEKIYKALDARFGKLLTKDEMKDNTKVGEKLKVLVENLSKGKNDDVKELQEKNHELQEQLEAKDTEIEEKEKAANKRADSTIIKSMFKDKLAAYSDDKLIGSRETVSKLLNTSINDEYDFKLSDSGEIMILQKGSDKQAEKGTDFLKVDTLITDTLENEKLLVQSTGGNGDGKDPKPAGSKTKEGVRVSERTGEEFEFVSQATKDLDAKLEAKGMTA